MTITMATDHLPPTDPPPGSTLRIQLLGGVGAIADDGRAVAVGPAKCQALLAALALSPGSAVPVGRLVELVWGDDPPRTAEKTLQSYVTQLRRSLGPGRVVRVGAAYRLDVDAEAVDVARFERRLATGDVSGALEEWTGPPLAGLEPAGLSAQAAGLVEQWLNAVETDLGKLVERDPAAAVGQLTELTSNHPFREGLWALLMTALYATGRQAEALSAYRQAREHLVEALGVEPGPELQALEARILDHDEGLPAPGVKAATGRTAASIPSGTVTFAFSDIEGSTRLWAEDRRRASAATARHEDIVRAVATNHDGYVFATNGDSFGVAFDRADDAARWALDVQAAIGSEPWPDSPVRVRMGLHTGDAEERAGSYFGPAVNVAGRIAAVANGGQVLVSGVTAALLSRGDVEDLGFVHLGAQNTEQPVAQLGPGRFPPLRAQDGHQGNLPRPQGRLFGRADLLEATVEALRESPVVTLVGPGGIGKTRLALDAARLAAADLGHSAWLVELADVTSPDEVVRAAADGLDVKELPGRSLLDVVVGSMRARRALLVLDNCEHVIDAAAELVAAVSEAGDEVRVLATSREGLGLDPEQLVVVGPLDVAGAGVELFDHRAAAVDRSFDGESHRAAVEEICRRLDGVPLAIELAAARIRTLSPNDLVQRLDESFRILTGGRRRNVERHRTLRATIQWSHDLLSAPEQVLFRRLSVFAGSFDLAAAEAVVPGGDLAVADVNRLLGDLVERSMVQVESGAYGRRFRMLETMRQFGAERLAEEEDPDLVAGRHARHTVEEIGRIAALLAGQEEIEGAGRLTEIWPNLRAAFDWATGREDLELARSLIGPIAAQTFLRRGVGEIVDWAQRLLAMADPDDDETIALGLLWTALHHTMTHDREAYHRVEARYGLPDHILAQAAHVSVTDDNEAIAELGPLAVAELRSRGDEYLASLFEVFEAGGLVGQGRHEDAEALLAPLAARLRAAGPPTFLNWVLYMMAASAELRGETDRAEALYDEMLAVEVPPLTNSPNDILAARVAFRRGHHRRAYTVLRDYVAELRDVGNMSPAGLLSIEFVNMMTAAGRLTEAAPLLGYLSGSGILAVDGPGFRLMVTEAERLVDADPEARAARQAVMSQGVDDGWALGAIGRALDRLLAEPVRDPLDPVSTGTPPGGDHRPTP